MAGCNSRGVPRQVDRSARLDTVRDAVVGIATQEGFAAVTIRRVAARAGASTSVVTHYVHSREELLRTAVQGEVAARRAQVEAAIEGRSGASAIRAIVEWAVLGPGAGGHRFWLALVVGAQTEPVLREELDGFNRWWGALLARCSAQMAPQPTDPAVLVDALDVVVDGLVLAGFEERAAWPAERRRRVLDALLDPLGL